MELVAATVGSIVSCVCHSEYLNNPTKEINTLRNKKVELIAVVEDIKRRLDMAEEHGKERTSETQNWLDRVNGLIAEVDCLEKKATRARRCLNGFLPNCCSRVHLGIDIAKLIKEANHLLEKADRYTEDTLTVPALEMGIEMVTTPLKGKTTILKKLEMTWECLMDEEIGIIGVYGMGGVGKTTMMKNINNRLLEQKHCFDKVIWVTVSKDANVHRIQLDIAKVIDLDLSTENDEAKRAALLFKKLRKRGRIVLILDDVWDAFSLHEIGIPVFAKDTKCKLVLTTRSLEVCQMMGCQKYIKVELLSNDEAWELFMEIVGVTFSAEMEKIAKDVVEECSCLPLAIVTIGASMRGKDDIQEWRVALIDLRESTNWTVNMEEKVIESLKFSYNRLGDDIAKKCFLYCSLYPEDFEFFPRKLIEHWVNEGLINGKSIEDELDRGLVILNKLKRCCLLECDSHFQNNCLKMHDLIRDMAIHITKTNPRFMVKAGLQLKKLGDVEEWDEDLEKVSFMRSEINEILIRPNCPALVTLLFNDNPLKHIPRDFFLHMQGLRVLNISSTQIELLPESVSDLVNLKLLDLSKCWNLKRVPSLEKLQSLRTLDLSSTAIEELPHGMEALINLKCLGLSNISRLREIPACIISKFSLLQELWMHPLHLSIDELLSLTHLKYLFITFSNLSDFTYYVGSENFQHLENFFIIVAAAGQKVHSYRNRYVSLLEDSNPITENALVLPQNTEHLEIEEFNEVVRLSELARFKDETELRKCRIQYCSEIEYMSSEEENCLLLQNLEDMEIRRCPKLISLYKGVVAPATLYCLKTLLISKCQNLKYVLSSMLFKQLQNLVELRIFDCGELEDVIKVSEEEEEMGEGTSTAASTTTSLKILHLWFLPKLKTLFSKRMLPCFQNLEELTIHRCWGMEELISEEVRSEGRNSNTVILPRLKKLHLELLPKLKSICRGEMVCDALQTIKVSWCCQLKRLPQFRGEDQSPPPALKEIKGGSKEWWNSLEWDAPSAKYILQPLFQEYKPFVMKPEDEHEGRK